MEEKFKIKGMMLFCFSNKDGLMYCILDYEKKYPQYPKGYFDIIKEKRVYNLIPGKEFVENVDSGCIISDDGSIANVFVDGYESNLGLIHKGFDDGYFLVDKETFLDICDKHDVIVNWANK